MILLVITVILRYSRDGRCAKQLKSRFIGVSLVQPPILVDSLISLSRRMTPSTKQRASVVDEQPDTFVRLILIVGRTTVAANFRIKSPDQSDTLGQGRGWVA